MNPLVAGLAIGYLGVTAYRRAYKQGRLRWAKAKLAEQERSYLTSGFASYLAFIDSLPVLKGGDSV